jgi:hypothetical protein
MTARKRGFFLRFSPRHHAATPPPASLTRPYRHHPHTRAGLCSRARLERRGDDAPLSLLANLADLFPKMPLAPDRRAPLARVSTQVSAATAFWPMSLGAEQLHYS